MYNQEKAVTTIITAENAYRRRNYDGRSRTGPRGQSNEAGSLGIIGKTTVAGKGKGKMTKLQQAQQNYQNQASYSSSLCNQSNYWTQNRRIIRDYALYYLSGNDPVKA